MRNEKDKPELSGSHHDRRTFMRRVGTAGLGLPAATLLVSLAGKRARADSYGYNYEDWDTPKPRGTTVMRMYDRGGVSEVMHGEPGGKGNGS